MLHFEANPRIAVIEHDPAPYMAALGIATELPKKKLRTMTQIFTGKGRGGDTVCEATTTFPLRPRSVRANP